MRSITNFGVFIDLGGADGLIHLSELSWHRVKRPQEVVAVGEEILVEVIRANRNAAELL
ncbi:MAG: S1 RNA-binding domain-containing protein [Anaerolineae bacterium]|nr:MAG: S1 RNA-binding domain-containing protein [Anaerolineae bacterium]